MCCIYMSGWLAVVVLFAYYFISSSKSDDFNIRNSSKWPNRQISAAQYLFVLFCVFNIFQTWPDSLFPQQQHRLTDACDMMLNDEM